MIKGSCIGSACHGAANGQGGFKLSFFGYEPDKDREAIYVANNGRRVNTGANSISEATLRRYGFNDFTSQAEANLLTALVSSLATNATTRSTLAARGITGLPYSNFPTAQTVRQSLRDYPQYNTNGLAVKVATPNQGATIASDSIQVTAVPLRKAAAQARHHLVALAAAAYGTFTWATRASSPRSGSAGTPAPFTSRGRMHGTRWFLDTGTIVSRRGPAL